jgi:hypothetical protein
MRGFGYHCFDGGGDLDLHPCYAMNLSEHDDGMTTNLQEQESGILKALERREENATNLQEQESGTCRSKRVEFGEWNLVGRSPWEELRPCAG